MKTETETICPHCKQSNRMRQLDRSTVPPAEDLRWLCERCNTQMHPSWVLGWNDAWKEQVLPGLLEQCVAALETCKYDAISGWWYSTADVNEALRAVKAARVGACDGGSGLRPGLACSAPRPLD